MKYINHWASLARTWQLMVVFSVVALLTTINLHYIGEEGVYTISTMEMLERQDWLQPYLYGEYYHRPPLFNWAIIIVKKILPFLDLLQASRLVTVISTAMTAYLLLWLAQALKLSSIAAFASAAAFLSGDVLLRRGWLAYADPIFTFFTTLSVIAIYKAFIEQRYRWLWLGAIAIFLSFLCKALTGYALFISAIIIASYYQKKFFFNWRALLPIMLAILLPMAWQLLAKRHSNHAMITDIIARFNAIGYKAYLAKILLAPFWLLLQVAPASIVALLAIKGKVRLAKWQLLLFCWVIINFLPYWFTPEVRTRYYLPLMPFLALGLTVMVYQANKMPLLLTLLLTVLALRYGLGLGGFAWYERNYRPDYQAIAYKIIQDSALKKLYVDDDTASTLSVVAYINTMQGVTLKRPPSCNALFLTKTKPNLATTLVATYNLGRENLYLLERPCDGTKN